MKNLTSTTIQKLTALQLSEIKVDAKNQKLILAEVNRRNKDNTAKRSSQDIFSYSKEIKGNKKLEKSFRSKTRNKINSLCNAINIATEVNDKEQIKLNCKEFITLYKLAYNLNDYSLASFRRLNSDKLTQMVLSNALITIKLFVAGKIK